MEEVVVRQVVLMPMIVGEEEAVEALELLDTMEVLTLEAMVVTL